MLAGRKTNKNDDKRKKSYLECVGKQRRATERQRQPAKAAVSTDIGLLFFSWRFLPQAVRRFVRYQDQGRNAVGTTTIASTSTKQICSKPATRRRPTRRSPQRKPMSHRRHASVEQQHRQPERQTQCSVALQLHTHVGRRWHRRWRFIHSVFSYSMFSDFSFRFFCFWVFYSNSTIINAKNKNTYTYKFCTFNHIKRISLQRRSTHQRELNAPDAVNGGVERAVNGAAIHFVRPTRARLNKRNAIVFHQMIEAKRRSIHQIELRQLHHVALRQLKQAFVHQSAHKQQQFAARKCRLWFGAQTHTTATHCERKFTDKTKRI